jgi:DUF4097 and DUF4098 domain-containing protein YvlB
MPAFTTPDPIVAVIEFTAGDARITASDRDDTVVEVHPSDQGDHADVRAAEQTRVEYADGRLLVKGPKQRTVLARPGSIDVTVNLPNQSQLQANGGIGAFHGEGQLGDCRVKTGAGDVTLARTGALDVSTGAGSITVDRVTDSADVTTATGQIRLGQVSGRASLKSSNGDVRVGAADGDLRVKSANGSVEVDQARTDVEATTANGDLRVGVLTRGTATLKTGTGSIEIGIGDGTAARLDAHTKFGKVRNQMQATDQPGPAEQTVEVYARTSFGDITVRRS